MLLPSISRGCFTRCQISSVMNGMMGCSTRKQVSRTDNNVCRILAFSSSVAVCSDLDTVAAYIANVDNFMDWIAYAEEAQVLESGDSRTLYYLKSSAPWPMRSRDMVYELKPRFDAGGTLHIAMRGLPDELPERRDAVRMDSVEGDWQFSVDGSEISVQLTLQVDPGRVAKFLANRRIASTVGLTLQALGDRFPCSTRLTVPD